MDLQSFFHFFTVVFSLQKTLNLYISWIFRAVLYIIILIILKHTLIIQIIYHVATYNKFSCIYQFLTVIFSFLVFQYIFKQVKQEKSYQITNCFKSFNFYFYYLVLYLIFNRDFFISCRKKP